MRCRFSICHSVSNERELVIRDEQQGMSVTNDAEAVVEYLVGWSLTDANGKPVPVSEASVNNLDGETYGEIVKIIDAHEATVEATRDLAKNAKGDENRSSETSSSVA